MPFWRFVIASFAALIMGFNSSYAADSQALQSFKKGLILKPYAILGYHVSEFITMPNVANGDFFGDLTKFYNWKVGLGLRVHQYFGFEVFYDSISRLATVYTRTGSPQISLYSQMVTINANFYTPSIDLKYASLEFGVNMGMTYLFGLETNSAIGNNIGNIGATSAAQYSGTTTTFAAGPQFVFGVSMMVGFAKIAVVRPFCDFIVLQNVSLPLPIILNVGLALNLYLF